MRPCNLLTSPTALQIWFARFWSAERAPVNTATTSADSESADWHSGEPIALVVLAMALAMSEKQSARAGAANVSMAAAKTATRAAARSATLRFGAMRRPVAMGQP